MEGALLVVQLECPVDRDLTLQLRVARELPVHALTLLGRELAVEVAHEVVLADAIRRHGYSTFISTSASRRAWRAWNRRLATVPSGISRIWAISP